jgi:glycosyltransferase involved in cell wall biosynthesis
LRAPGDVQPMKAGVIAFPLDRPVRGGIDRYVHRLAREFDAMPGAAEFVWIHGEPFRQDSPLRGGHQAIQPETGLFGAAARRRWSRRNLDGLDVLFGPYFGVLPGPFAKVMTVHDLYAFTSGDAGLLWTARFRAATRRMASACDWIIADSDASRKQVIELLGFPAERTVTVHLGADTWPNHSETQRQEARTALRAAFHWPAESRIILFVGALIARKDPFTLLRAFAALHKARPDTRLLFCGAFTKASPPIFDEAERLGIRSVVAAPGAVDDSGLRRAYAGADLFALPSLFEGYGLPALEAMAAGLPAVLSSGGALPEVAEGAALFSPPGDPGALGANLERVLDDPALQARLRAKGHERATMFTWSRCAKETLAVLEQAAANK